MIDQLLDSGAFWQMSMAEKASFWWLISEMDERQVAIEVGTYCGGSLRVLDMFFRKVYSLDVDHSRVDSGSYHDVEFITGNSRETLPVLLEQLSDKTINLVLIDADHNYDAVLHDINAVLQYRPLGTMFVLMHDSWYEQVRLAIDHAAWSACPYVQEVEKDFCVGDLNGNGFIGGLALAVLTPEERTGPLVIHQTHDYMYRSCLAALRLRRNL